MVVRVVDRVRGSNKVRDGQDDVKRDIFLAILLLLVALKALSQRSERDRIIVAWDYWAGVGKRETEK